MMLPVDEQERVRRAYLRQVRRQVYLPLGLGALVVIGLAILAGTLQVAAVGTWADMAIVFLLIPIMLLGLILLGVTIGAGLMLARVIPRIPAPAARLRQYWHRYSRMAERGADLMAEPIVKGVALGSGVASVAGQVRGMMKLILGGRDGD
jgi:hypothetical protein